MQHGFALTGFGDLNYFMRIHVSKTTQSLHLSQAKYIAYLLAKHKMANYSPCFTSITISHHLTKNSGCAIDNASQYRSIVGALQYITLPRPEIAFPVNKLSQFLSNPSEEHWQACKRLLSYLKGTIHLDCNFISMVLWIFSVLQMLTGPVI